MPILSNSFSRKCNCFMIDIGGVKGVCPLFIFDRYSLKSKYITPQYKKLIANNHITYAGKDLDFRLSNPRDFKYKGEKNIDVILVDDVVTTGTTLKEAKKVLANFGVNVLFCVVLVDKRW